MPKFYVGITIGPIMETLYEATRPASLWCASAMFSWLSEDICNRVLALNGNIVSPYYPKEANKDNVTDYSVTSEGIGKYHDRIIFSIEYKSQETLSANVADVIAASKTALAKQLIDDEDEQQKIVNYLQVRYIVEQVPETFEDDYQKNCILRLSPYLDAAELCAAFDVDQTNLPIKKIFEGETKDGHNALLKKILGLGTGKVANLTVEKKNEKGNKFIAIKDIESIAKNGTEGDKKSYDYYAIVQADGDSMGKYLAKLTDDEKVQDFSKQCLDYTRKAAECVNKFGGVTIYAGGDDLLFIAPLIGKDSKTVFQLCEEIRSVFLFNRTPRKLRFHNKKFMIYKGLRKYKCKFPRESNEDCAPTLSFGISINYVKFPLYEALKDAVSMLIGTAKDVKSGEHKNRTAVHLRKHSGHSVKFKYTNDSDINKQLNALIAPDVSQTVLKSMLYKLDLYRPILKAALNSEMALKDSFNNLFDSLYHNEVKTYIDNTCKALEIVYNYIIEHPTEDFALENITGKKGEINTERDNAEKAIDLLISMLRIARFYSEKKGEK